jgi:hypothetical protein
MSSKSEASRTTLMVCRCSSSTQTLASHSLYQHKAVQHPVKSRSRLTLMPKPPVKVKLTPDIERPKLRIYKLPAMHWKKWFLTLCCDHPWTMTASSNSSPKRRQIIRICFESAHPQLRSKLSFQFRKIKTLWGVEVMGQETVSVQLLAQRLAKASPHNLSPTFSSVVCPSSSSRWSWNKNSMLNNIMKSTAQALWLILWRQQTNEPTQNQVLGHQLEVTSKRNWLVQ